MVLVPRVNITRVEAAFIFNRLRKNLLEMIIMWTMKMLEESIQEDDFFNCYNTKE